MISMLPEYQTNCCEWPARMLALQVQAHILLKHTPKLEAIMHSVERLHKNGRAKAGEWHAGIRNPDTTIP